MMIVYKRVVGLDLHKKTAVAAWGEYWKAMRVILGSLKGKQRQVVVQ
jgi:hypothetical protein